MPKARAIESNDLVVPRQRIENPLSKLILEGRFPPKSTIPVDVDPVREPGVFHFGNAQPVPEEETA